MESHRCPSAGENFQVLNTSELGVKHHQSEVLAMAIFGGWSIESEMATRSELLEANLQEALMRANPISSFYMWLRV